MVVGESLPVDAVDPGLIRALARHLDHLKSCPEGIELRQLIDDALLYCRENGYVNGSSVAYLHGRLLAYTRDLTRPSAIRIRARLIQQHLALYLPRPDHVIPVNNAKPAPGDRIAGAPEVANAAEQTPAAGVTPKRRPTHEPKPNLTEHYSMQSEATPEPVPAPVAVAVETRSSVREDKTQNLDALREMLTNSMDELVRERETLTQKLSDTTSYLQMIEAEREQLRVELNKARKRTRSNEKSPRKLGLPKRDVLLRQIESEVERVKRHGNPLALALIDINAPETGGESQTLEVAKAALDRYTSEILGSFRSYDLVARYNKDEFAVLLPNTDKENAMRALEKIRKRAKETHFSHKGRSYPLPGFGGVLTFYAPGEEPMQMLRRADEALVNQKLKGQRQVVVV
ncbi:MAG: GGDEF domain-containing protein [Sulfuricaulis sp.]